MLRRRLIIAIVTVLGFLIPAAAFASSGGIDAYNYRSHQCSDTNCASYTEVYWRTTHGPPVVVTDTGLSGYIWSSAYGWINLDPTNGGVHNTTSGVLSGYAWSTTAGWINFSPTFNGEAGFHGVRIDPTSGQFSGYAWASGAGWMDFDCTLGADACVTTTWRPTVTHTTTGCSSCGSTTTTTTTTTTDTTSTTTNDTTTTSTNDTTGTTDTTGTGTTTTTTGTGTTSTTGGNTGGTTGGSHGGSTIPPPPPPVYPDIVWTRGSCGEPRATNVGGEVVGQVKTSFCETSQKVEDTVAALKAVFTSPKANVVSTAVGAVGVIAGSAFTIGSTLFLNPLSFSEIFLIPARLWSLLMAALGLKKRRRPWGTVYDSATKQPLDPVYVTLRKIDGTEVTSSITDLDGRFGFVVPEPGMYGIFAKKTNYLFPSQQLVGRDHDELYRDLYFGEYFKVENAGDAVYKNIPMDAEHFDWNEYAKKQQRLMKFYSRRDAILKRLADIFFVGGFTVATLAVIFAPKTYNVLIFCLYIALFFVRRSGAHSRPFGDIADASGTPLSYALIRISSATTDVEVMHRIADVRGRYYALLPNGEYRVRIDRKNPDGTYATVATGLPVTVEKGYMAKKFSI